jgi:hypothetical protein
MEGIKLFDTNWQVLKTKRGKRGSLLFLKKKKG